MGVAINSTLHVLRGNSHLGFLRWSIAVLLALGIGVGAADGQSITDGSLIGTVVGADGSPMFDVRVVVTDARSGVSQSLSTEDDGRFVFHLLQPGDYDLLAEKLGFQPVIMTGMPVRPGAVLRQRLVLLPAQLPVNQVDTAAFSRASAESSRSGVSTWFSDFALAGLPGETRSITNVGRLSGASNRHLESEGLTRWMSGYTVDGITYRGVRPPQTAFEIPGAPALPPSAFLGAELVTNGVDTEWSGYAGSTLSAFSLRGGRNLELGVFGDWSGAAVASSKYFDPQDLSYSSWRGGARFAGPIVRDTASFVIGVEATQTQTPLPRAWVDTSRDDSLLTLSDSLYGVDLSPYVLPRLVATKTLAAYGRFDWQIRNHSFRLRASGGSFRESDSDLEPTGLASIESQYEGVDAQASMGLTSVFSPSFMSEFRLGLESDTREYFATEPTGSSMTVSGIGVGLDPRLPERSGYSAVRVSETLHFPFGLNHVKIGVGAFWANYAQTYSFAREGNFSFGGIEQYANAQGSFVQSVGAFPIAEFTNWQFYFLAQGHWYAAPGLTLTGGMRYQRENVPLNDIRLNTDWLRLTGISNNGSTVDSLGIRVAAKEDVNGFYPRFGFTWQIGANREWVIRGGAGLYRNELEAPVMAEVITLDGTTLARRGLTTFGTWPNVPDSTLAPIQGQLLSLLGTNWEKPQTARFSLGLTRSLDSRSTFHLSGEYRHTDFITRRHDINRSPLPLAQDQYGRSIWGVIEQQGSQVTAVPGSNRRFNEFDVVSALDADGFSDYWEVTVALERQISRAWRLWAQYTGSATRDNWLGARGGGPDRALSPFPDSLNGVAWDDGRSDLDVPNRVILATEIQFSGIPVSVAGFYRYSSGPTFTPGFRAGVDANGDGSGVNDPAFVDDNVPGVSELVSRWDCLRTQVGQFAERNSCRQPGINQLDLRVAISLFRSTRFPTEIVIDGVNLVESNVGVPDNALYLVDPNASITVDPNSRVVNVPLVANANFGQLLVQRTMGRFIRVGARVNY